LEGKKLYLYEEEKSQKQQGQHLYYRISHNVSGHLMAVYLQKRQTIPGRHSSDLSKILMISSSN
jgi:hypothetical protein